MRRRPINQLLAEGLRHYMAQRNIRTQAALAQASHVAQTTISIYLDPDRRESGSKGKAGSAKLTEVDMLAAALKLEVWELLRGRDSADLSALTRDEKELLVRFRALRRPESERALLDEAERLSTGGTPNPPETEDWLEAIREIDNEQERKAAVQRSLRALDHMEEQGGSGASAPAAPPTGKPARVSGRRRAGSLR